jgi:hypothetical protein
MVNNFDVQVVGVCGPTSGSFFPEGNHAEERVDVCCQGLFARLALSGIDSGRTYRAWARVTEAQAELDALAAGFVASHPSAYPNGLR